MRHRDRRFGAQSHAPRRVAPCIQDVGRLRLNGIKSMLVFKEGGLNVIDLFSGAGGLSVGLAAAGWQIALAVENNRYACATYRHNHPHTPILEQDICSVDFAPWRGNVDLVAGGPPCQPFSVAGHQRASADERDCVPHFIHVVATVQPKAFLMENVAGLATLRNKVYLHTIIKDFQDLGYVVTYAVLDAAHYGVPQYRRRLIIVGMREAVFIFPAPTHGPGTHQPLVTARTALANVPPSTPNQAIVTYAKKPVLRPSPYAGMLVNGGGRPINLDEPCQTIPASAGGNRTPIVDQTGIFAAYHQYLLAGGKPKQGVVQGVRRLTVHEAARLQDFPSDYTFIGPTSAQYRQIGNAVPSGLAQAVGAQLMLALSEPQRYQHQRTKPPLEQLAML